jgi:hypothetical protein
MLFMRYKHEPHIAMTKQDHNFAYPDLLVKLVAIAPYQYSFPRSERLRMSSNCPAAVFAILRLRVSSARLSNVSAIYAFHVRDAVGHNESSAVSLS